MGRRFGADQFGPGFGELGRGGGVAQAEIAQDPRQDGADPDRLALGSALQDPASSSERNTSPVGSFGTKKVDFWGRISPRPVTRKTSSGESGFR